MLNSLLKVEDNILPKIELVQPKIQDKIPPTVDWNVNVTLLSSR